MVQAILVTHMQGTLSDNPTEPDWFDTHLVQISQTYFQ